MDEKWAVETRRRARIMLMASYGPDVDYRERGAHVWHPMSSVPPWNWSIHDYRMAGSQDEPIENEVAECECCQDAPKQRAVVVLKGVVALFGYEQTGGSPFRVQLTDARTVDTDSCGAADAIDLALRGPMELTIIGVIPAVTIPDPTLIIECTREAVEGWEAATWPM